MTQPQWSPDRQWWWDGSRWIPAAQAPPSAHAAGGPAPAQAGTPAAAPEGETTISDAPPWAMPTAGSTGQVPWSQSGPPRAEGSAGQQPPWAEGSAGQQPPWAEGSAGQQPPWAGTQPAGSGYPPAGQPPQGYGVPQGAAPPYGWAPHPAPASRADGKAVASLVLSLVWACGLGSIAAVVLGHMSRQEAKRAGRQPSGVATAGVVLGAIGIVGGLLALLLLALGFAFKDEIVEGIDVAVELQSAAEAQRLYHQTNGTYTSNLEALQDHGYVDLSDKTSIRVVSATETTFCISGTSFGETQYIDQTRDTPSTTPCR